MRKRFNFFPVLLIISALAGITVPGCNNTSGVKDRSEVKARYDSLALKKNLTAPVLSAEEGIKKIHLEKGFTVKLVASEPLVTAPVAL
ncbi:MAG TPA: hypothetical protein VKA92_02290, partial [Segetibacter sp.]|nr:hypothetical protein [Segetibacter sp.]